MKYYNKSGVFMWDVIWLTLGQFNSAIKRSLEPTFPLHLKRLILFHRLLGIWAACLKCFYGNRYSTSQSKEAKVDLDGSHSIITCLSTFGNKNLFSLLLQRRLWFSAAIFLKVITFFSLQTFGHTQEWFTFIHSQLVIVWVYSSVAGSIFYFMTWYSQLF